MLILKFDTEIHIKLFFNIPFETFQWCTLVIYSISILFPEVFAFSREDSSKKKNNNTAFMSKKLNPLGRRLIYLKPVAVLCDIGSEDCFYVYQIN